MPKKRVSDAVAVTMPTVATHRIDEFFYSEPQREELSMRVIERDFLMFADIGSDSLNDYWQPAERESMGNTRQKLRCKHPQCQENSIKQNRLNNLIGNPIFENPHSTAGYTGGQNLG